jgi:lipopolysaccharide transport system permease protein
MLEEWRALKGTVVESGSPVAVDQARPAASASCGAAETARSLESAQRPDLCWLTIKPTPGWRAINLKELWQFRELLWFLALRDIQVRYKQTALGVAWALIQPLLAMILFTIFFGRLAGLDQRTGDIPYPVFTFCALVPWQFFSFALTQSSNSVVSEQRLLTKVYFPRLIIPMAPVFSALVDFGVSFLLLLGMMIYYRVGVHASIILLPAFVLMAVLASLLVGLWLSALNAIYRDVRYAVPFLTQFWLFATPVAYPAKIVPERWQWLYGLNPMVGVIEGFRWSMLGTEQPPWGAITVSSVVTILLLVGGLYYFRRMEKTFADVV